MDHPPDRCRAPAVRPFCPSNALLGVATVDSTVLEIKYKLTGHRLVYPCRACLLEPPNRAVLFYVSTSGWQHEQPVIRVPPGTRTFAYYWRDRDFNVYHWLNADGSTIGFYFNVATQTSIRAWGVEWTDLELDYWVDADGNAAAVDEEAVPVPLSPPLFRLIANVKDDLVVHAPSIAAQIQRQTTGYLANLRA
jgi:Protein of unknown function (DUF402)